MPRGVAEFVLVHTDHVEQRQEQVRHRACYRLNQEYALGCSRMISIQDSVTRYEARLRSVLKSDLVESDLQYKHRRMGKDPFLFLRATCWRWAETADSICPDLANAPRVLSVGDAHVENFGIWRDTDGRLVWGVNDFDEAGSTP